MNLSPEDQEMVRDITRMGTSGGHFVPWRHAPKGQPGDTGLGA